nr:MAG TPA_asm: hypothetical protein [Caudoviricetes sp.]
MASWLSKAIASLTSAKKQASTASSSRQSSATSARAYSPERDSRSGSTTRQSQNLADQRLQILRDSNTSLSASSQSRPLLGDTTPASWRPRKEYPGLFEKLPAPEQGRFPLPNNQKREEAKPSETTGHVSMFDDRFIDSKSKPVEDAGEIRLTDEQFNALSPQAQQAILLQTDIYNAAKKDLADKSGQTNVRASLKNLGIDAGMADAYSDFQGFLGLEELKDLANFDEKLSSELMPKKSDFFEPGYGAMHAAMRRNANTEEGKVSESNETPIALHGFGQGINLTAANSVSTPTITELIRSKQKKDDPKGYEEAMTNLPDEIQGLDLNRLLTRDARINLSRRAIAKVEEENGRPFEEKYPTLAGLEAREDTEGTYSYLKQLVSVLSQGGFDEEIDGALPREMFEEEAAKLSLTPVELSRAIGEYSSRLKAENSVALLDGFDISNLAALDRYIDLEF